MYLIGLTGNIGAGKSTVAARLGAHGALVVDADAVYREIAAPGQPAWQAVVHLFGTDVVAASGEIDRRRLGAIVFRDPAALARLEQATHPLILARIDEIIAAAQPIVAVHEAIKLIESGSADRCDEVWVVTAPRALQIARLVAARGLTSDEAALRVDAQPPVAAKIARADVVIANDGDLAALDAAVDREWRRITRRLGASATAAPSRLSRQSGSGQASRSGPRATPRGLP